MTSTSSGPVNCCLAQMLLEMKNIRVVRPLELGRLMNVHHTCASWILQELGWTKVPLLNSEGVEYHYAGIDKVFRGTERYSAHIRLSRLLNMSVEKIKEEMRG